MIYARLGDDLRKEGSRLQQVSEQNLVRALEVQARPLWSRAHCSELKWITSVENGIKSRVKMKWNGERQELSSLRMKSMMIRVRTSRTDSSRHGPGRTGYLLSHLNTDLVCLVDQKVRIR